MISSFTLSEGFHHQVTLKAKNLGFIAVGLKRAGRPPYFDEFVSRIRKHKYGEMTWLEKSIPLRENPSRLLKGCETIFSLAYPYSSQIPKTTDGFRVSRHADPINEDYHSKVKTLCRELTELIKEFDGRAETKICVDSAPILEKSIAYAAGLGFIGKNSLLIIPGMGSYFYLAEILCTLPIPVASRLPLQNQCGTCTLCIRACPTGALEGPYSLDASKCLSYLTIEEKGEWQALEGNVAGDSFFGCDRCQEVCPFNGEGTSSLTSLPSTGEFLKMEEAEFTKQFGRSTLARAGLAKIRHNIRVIRG